MATRKTVTIFTGHVDQKPLERDVRSLAESLGRLRAVFAGRGVRLRTERWDDEATDEMRQIIAESDVCIFLFCTDLPPLARMQFDVAYETLSAGAREGSPSIFVWFREEADQQLSEELMAFQDELDHSMGHFFNRYVDVDTVQFQLLLHLEREGAGVPFACVGTTLVDTRGNVVMDFDQTAAYCGNEALRSARQRIEALESRYQGLLDKELEDELDDDENAELDELVERIEQAAAEERALQERFIADMRQYVHELADDREMSPRRRQAIRLISAGRVREGYELLDAKEIERDARTHEARAQVAATEVLTERGQVLDGVKSLLMRVRLLRTFVEEEGEIKNAEIRQTYAVAIDFEERNGFEPLAQVGYGEYLVDLGVYDKAVDLLDAACVWYRRALTRVLERAQGRTDVPADPFTPGETALKRSLAHALDLMAQASMGAEAPASAAYAVSERMDLLRELYASEESDLDARGYALRLVSAAEVMKSASRPDDALDYLEEACEILAEACEDDSSPEMLDALAQALEARRDIFSDLSRAGEAARDSQDLLAVLRRLAMAADDEAVEARLTRELRSAAHVALDLGDHDRTKALAQEALDVERERQSRNPSAAHAVVLSEGLRHSSVIAARLRESNDYCALSARRLAVLIAEYRRMPDVDVQAALKDCVTDLCSRWSNRHTHQLAEALLPELISLADSLEGIEAPGENALDTGTIVGDAIGWAVAMMRHLRGEGSDDADRLFVARLNRLRAGAGSVRGGELLSGAFERLAWHLALAARPAQAYGLVAERLCTLRIACGAETVDARSYATTEEDFQRLRDLVHALGYAAQYARSHGRPAEGQALLGERLDLLRENFAARRGVSDAYTLNRALFEMSEYRLARQDQVGFAALLEEAWRNACELHEDAGSLATMRNLFYVGRNVNSRYRDAGDDARADEVLRACVDYALAYHDAHRTTEVTAWIAHIVWMYVAGLRTAGRRALADELFATYRTLIGELAQADANDYLSYLHRYLNHMVDYEPDAAFAQTIAAVHVEAADDAYRAKVARAAVLSDDLVTYSSVLELAILVTLEKHYDELADTYVARCIALYEERPDRVAAQAGEGGSPLSEEECAGQLSKELTRLSRSMRRFGRPDRADELDERSIGILRSIHEANPGSRASFIYSSQLFNDSERLRHAGDMAGALALREESVRVLDRYRQADPTERNLLWYTRALVGLAQGYRIAGRIEDADRTEQVMLGVLDERYRTERSRSLLNKYLLSMAKLAKRLHDEGGASDERALALYEECVHLADDSYRTYHDVESARQLSQMMTYLRYQLISMGRGDDARDNTTRQVEVLRFLFAQNPTLTVARVFAGALKGEIGRLRYLGKRLERTDYRDRANELHGERIQVMLWAAGRDRTIGEELARMLEAEVSLRDPKEPWVLKSMRKSIEGGHNYPSDLGVKRARTCIETLWILFRDEPTQELAERLCDMKGVLVQFLMFRRRELDGSPEAEETYRARVAEAATELYELVPMLEERLSLVPDDEHTYRLTYYLKIASDAFETVGATDDALDALARRTEALRERNMRELSVTSGFKYLHALRDQAALYDRMGLLDEALKLEGARAAVCGGMLRRDDLDESKGGALVSELRSCYEHRDRLLAAQGAEALAQRRANLQAYADFVRPRAEEGRVSAATLLVDILGRAADCAKEAGDIDEADGTYRAAIDLEQETLQEADPKHAARLHELHAELMGGALVVALTKMEQSQSARDAEEAASLEAASQALLEEALAQDTEELATDKRIASAFAQLYEQRYRLRLQQGNAAGALEDATRMVAYLEVDGVCDDVLEYAAALAKLGKAHAACGQHEESEQIRERKTSLLRAAYADDPQPDLGLYLAFDLGQRGAHARQLSAADEALSFARERLEVLCDLTPQDADQRAKWKTQFRNALNRLLALTENMDENTAPYEVLVAIERGLASKVQEQAAGMAGAHLDVMRRLIERAPEDGEPTSALVARYARQACAYGGTAELEPAALAHHLGEAAQYFDAEGFQEDAAWCRSEALRLLQRRWQKTHDVAVGQALDQQLTACLDACQSAQEEFALVKAQYELVRTLHELSPEAAGVARIRQLADRAIAAAEATDARAEAAALRLALVSDDYVAVDAGEPLEPHAVSIVSLLGAAAEDLRAIKATREAGWLDSEARNCERSLGKPGFSWWRSGWGSIGRGWRRGNELGLVQGRLQKASLLLERSLELGDWDESDLNHRNLRNLMGLRLGAYRKGLDDATRARKLNSLRWCLYNAAATLRRERRRNPQLLQESVVLRCELLEVLFDIAVLKHGTKDARGAEHDYVEALRALVRQLQGREYEGLVYQDVRQWAQERIDAARAEIAERAKGA